jgi:hypothetical protein
MTTEKAEKDPGPSLTGDAKGISDAPPSVVRVKTGLGATELRAFLSQPETQGRIHAVVIARSGRRITAAVLPCTCRRRSPSIRCNRRFR